MGKPLYNFVFHLKTNTLLPSECTLLFFFCSTSQRITQSFICPDLGTTEVLFSKPPPLQIPSQAADPRYLPQIHLSPSDCHLAILASLMQLWCGSCCGFEQGMKTGIFVLVLDHFFDFAKFEHLPLESAAARCHLTPRDWGQDLSNSLRFYIYCYVPGPVRPFPNPGSCGQVGSDGTERLCP